MANTQIKPTTREKLIQASQSGLEQINSLLQKNTGVHSIDEVAVLTWSAAEILNGAQEATLVFSFSLSTNNDRRISEEDLSSAHISVLFDTCYDNNNAEHVVVHEVKGQAGELFDFVVPIRYNNQEYFIFGNYLGGTMENLEKNPYWKMAKNSFIHLAITLGGIIAETNGLPQHSCLKKTRGSGFLYLNELN